MAGKRDKQRADQDWHPKAVGDRFILVFLNGREMLQVVNHYEDPAHWGSCEPPFSEPGDDGDLPRWYVRDRSTLPEHIRARMEHARNS